MNKIASVGTLAALWILVLLLSAHVLIIYPGWSVIERAITQTGVAIGRLDAPAWVQAIGSILAIVAAALIAGYQSNQARKLDVDREVRAKAIRKLAVRGLLKQAGQVLVSAAKAIEPKTDQRVVWNWVSAETQRVRGQVASLPILEFQEEDLLSSLQYVERSMSLMQQYGEVYMADTNNFKYLNLASFCLGINKELDKRLEALNQ